VEFIPCGGLLRHTLAKGALLYPSKVVKDSHGEPARTTLYVILPSVWGSVDGDC